MPSTQEIGKRFSGLKGTDKDKERADALVRCAAGLQSASEAAQSVDLSPSRFHELLGQFLQGGLDAIAPGQPGRPRQEPATPPAVDHLQATHQFMLAAMRMLALTLGCSPKPREAPQTPDALSEALTAFEGVCMDILARAQEPAVPDIDPKTRRLRQDDDRQEENATRRRILELTSTLMEAGLTAEQIAQGSGIAATTLREWKRKQLAGELAPVRRGRPRTAVDLRTRQAITETMALLGPRVSIKALLRLFTEVPRRILIAMRQRFRHSFRRRGRIPTWRLLWTTPRTVWSIDGLDPPGIIGEHHQKALVVRDMAPGKTLTIQAVPAEDAASTVALLESLFASIGPPLVLKADNGSGFSNEDVQALCARWCVVLLYSPPYSPWYQGHIETGMAAIRDAVDEITARAGRPGQWTQGDLDLARIELNQSPKIAHDGLTPAEVWRRAVPIKDEEREQFYCRYSAQSPGHQCDPAMERSVIERVLIDSGLLEKTVHWIPRRKPKQGTVRHVAGRLADMARELGRHFVDICEAVRRLLEQDAQNPLPAQSNAC